MFRFFNCALIAKRNEKFNAENLTHFSTFTSWKVFCTSEFKNEVNRREMGCETKTDTKNCLKIVFICFGSVLVLIISL